MIMIFSRLPKRSSATIVQQMNCITSKQMFLDFFSGKPLNIPPGSEQRSFDCEDQVDVDWDSRKVVEADNLIDQHFMRQSYLDALHPQTVSESNQSADNNPPASDPGTQEEGN